MKIPKILIVLPSYDIGGTTVCLYNYLSLLNKEKVCVSLMALIQEGPYKYKYPNCEELIPNVWFAISSRGLTLKNKIVHKVLFGIRALTQRILHHDLLKQYFQIGYRLSNYHYDYVICFSESISQYVQYIPIEKKIAWVHCDFKRVITNNNYKLLESAYAVYQKIVLVSIFGKKQFDDVFPQFKGKTVTIHNVVNKDELFRKSLDESEVNTTFDDTTFTIISVGRLDPIKQFDKIPSIACKLKSKVTKPFKWYIIGGGFPEELLLLEERIQIYGVSNHVICLGEKQNVYPYIKNSNLLVNVSTSEAFSLVNIEALTFNVPVVSNNFECAPETVRNGIDGYIVPVEEMADKIASIINDGFTINEYSWNNEESLTMFYSLFSEIK